MGVEEKRKGSFVSYAPDPVRGEHRVAGGVGKRALWGSFVFIPLKPVRKG